MTEPQEPTKQPEQPVEPQGEAGKPPESPPAPEAAVTAAQPTTVQPQQAATPQGKPEPPPPTAQPDSAAKLSAASGAPAGRRVPRDGGSAATKPFPSFDGLLDNVQNLLTSLVALGAVLTGGGFVIVNGFLNSYNAPTSHAIVTSQYIAAGVGFVSFTIIIFMVDSAISSVVIKLLKDRNFMERDEDIAFITMSLFVALFGGAGALSRLAELLIPTRTIFDDWSWFLYAIAAAIVIRFVLERVHDHFVNKSTDDPGTKQATLLSLLLITVVSTIVLGTMYGLGIYWRLPRALGGGQDAPIQLTAKAAKSLNNLGIETDDSGNSEVLCLLAELDNGILVYSPVHRRAVTVLNHDEILLGYSSAKLDENLSCTPPYPPRKPAQLFRPAQMADKTIT